MAYRRVHLAARRIARRRIHSCPPATLAVLDPENRWTLEPGVYEVTLGTSAQGGLTGTFELAN